MNLFLPMLGVGLVASIHCVAMCGSMVLTYAVKDSQDGPLLKRMLPHFAYHTAKLTSYVLVGLALGAIGSAFNFAGIRGWVSVAAGIFMVTLGLQMTGWFPALARFSFRPPKLLVAALSKTRKRAVSDAAEGRSSLLTPITFGLMTGLMPCGPLQGAQLAAAASGSPVSGAIAMLGFGLGTMPLMLGFGAVSGMLGVQFKKRMMVVAAMLVMVLGLVMLDRGAMLVGSPITSNTIKQAVLGAPAPAVAAEYKKAADGAVLVPLTIKNTQFVPAALSIPSGERVRLVVDRREDNACSAQLAVPQLGVLANLKPNGVTQVDLPAAKAGAYTLTCGMGMMSGSITAGGGAGGAGQPNMLVLTLLALLAAIVPIAWYQRRRRLAAPEPAPEGKRSGGRTAPAPANARGASRSRNGRAGGNAPGLGAHSPASATVFGFTPVELIGIASALAAAVVIGLGAGGFFTS